MSGYGSSWRAPLPLPGPATSVAAISRGPRAWRQSTATI